MNAALVISPVISCILISCPRWTARRKERMPRDRQPFAHQIEAWEAARGGLLLPRDVGDPGSGKTECFMVPVLDDLLRDLAKGQLS